METNNFNSLYEFHAVDQAIEDEFCKSSELRRLYTRRRSISLTSEVDQDLILPIVAKVRIQRETSQPGAEPIDDESVLDRLGLPATDADRSSGLRRGHLRDLRSPSPQRRSGPSRGPGAPPVSSEPPPLQFPAGTAGIRPGYRH